VLRAQQRAALGHRARCRDLSQSTPSSACSTGEIEQLRKIGKTAAEIEALIREAIGRPLSLAATAPG
jgi:hypothetical protein